MGSSVIVKIPRPWGPFISTFVIDNYHLVFTVEIRLLYSAVLYNCPLVTAHIFGQIITDPLDLSFYILDLILHLVL